MKKKWIVAATLALVTSLIFTGCTSPKEDVTGSTKGNSIEKTTLVFWSVGLKLKDDSGEKTPEELEASIFIKNFEAEHPGVTIEVIDQPVDSINDLFKAANISEKGPDIVGLWSGSFTNEYQKYLLPLDEYLTKEEIDSYTGLDLCRVDFKEDGKIIALPYNLTTYNIFYNKEYFDAAGISEENLPTTWDELLEVAKKLEEAGHQPFLIGDSGGESTTWITSDFMGDLVGPEKIVEFGSSTLPYSCDEYIQSLTVWQNLFSTGYTNSDFSSLGAWDSIQRFVIGEGAMNINGSWAIGEIEPIMGENVGTFKIPAITKEAEFGDYIVSQPGANVSVTTYSKNKDLAAEFIKYITSAKAEGAFHKDTGDLPANNQVDVQVITNPLSKEAYSWIQENKAVIGYDSLIPLEAATELYKLGPTLCSGKITPAELVAKLETIQK